MAGLSDRQVGGYDEGIDPFEAMQGELSALAMQGFVNTLRK